MPHLIANFNLRYHFTTVDCRAYLPPYDCVTIYFLKALISGKKKFLHADAVQYLSVPQYEGLGIKDFLAQAAQYPATEQYLPEQDELRRLPRQWVINLTYTLVGKPFADWVLEHIEARNRRLMEERDLAIQMDPDILRAFQASTHISSK